MGGTQGSGIPLANPGGGAYFDNTFSGLEDAFIAQFSGSNLGLLWSTFFGGTNLAGNDFEKAYSVAVDGSGNVFVVGITNVNFGFPLS